MTDLWHSGAWPVEEPMRRYYFAIRSANVIECIWAQSFTEAKTKAAMTWMPWWQEIEWLNPHPEVES